MQCTKQQEQYWSLLPIVSDIVAMQCTKQQEQYWSLLPIVSDIVESQKREKYKWNIAKNVMRRTEVSQNSYPRSNIRQ